MKNDPNMLFLNGNIRKYKVFASVKQFMLFLKNISGTEILYRGNNHHEKLPIMYANLRV